MSNCLLCHAGQIFAGVPAPYIADVDLRRLADQGDAACAAAHPDPGRRRLQRVPRRGLPGRRLRAGHGDERRQACVRIGGLRYLPRGRARASIPAAARRCSCGRPITPRRTWSHRTTAAAAMRRPTGTAPCCPPGTCRIPATRPATSATPAPADQLHDPGDERGAAHRHQQRLQPVPWHHGATLTFYNNFPVKVRLADARAHSVPARHRLQSPATLRQLRGGRLRSGMTMNAATHAFVSGSCDTVPRGGPGLLSRRCA